MLEQPDQPDSDAVFLYPDPVHQALLINQLRDGELCLRYVPVSAGVEHRGGELEFSRAEWQEGEPLKLAPSLAMESADVGGRGRVCDKMVRAGAGRLRGCAAENDIGSDKIPRCGHRLVHDLPSIELWKVEPEILKKKSPSSWKWKMSHRE